MGAYRAVALKTLLNSQKSLSPEQRTGVMEEVNPGNENPQNMTIYINKLNEKIKLEGDAFTISFSLYVYTYCVYKLV